MSNCANKQVARKLHSKIVNISVVTSCCGSSQLRGPNNRLISVQTSELASRASFAKFCPNALVLLLLVLINLVGCDLRSNQSSKVVSLHSEGLWRPTVLISSLKSEISFEHQNLVSIPLAEQMCISNSQDSQATLSSPINVASFAHNHIQSLEQNAFTCLADNLKILILRHNKIWRIADGAFNGLKSVQVLLLDNNLLKEVPSKTALGSLKALRHLNLAHNKIEQLDEGAFGGASANLISLNLKGNPLSRFSFNSLAKLTNLNTLTLSHSALSGRLEPLKGLSELRFYHLDRAANLSSISEDLCADSRKLSSLVLKSNQLERIPQFASCHSLLLIDLSYNKINGPLNDATFERQTNLIDLYLGHNQIESISENSFAGLKKLQVLELSNNHLKWIHQNAFLPIRSTITELDLSNNHQLMALSSLGLEKLVSLKVFGNQQLRELPHFKSASNLALTYAYHCCDYLTAPSSDEQDFNSNLVESDGSSTNDNSTSHNESSPNLVNQLLASISSTFNHILSNGSAAATNPKDTNSAELDTTNLTEVIVWPAEYYRDTTSSIHLDKSSRIKRQQRAREDNNELLEDVNFLSENSISEDQVLTRPKLASDTDWLPSLIDELVWQVEEIRSVHSISLASGQLGVWQHRIRPVGGKRDANLTKQLADLIDPRATDLIEAELCEQVARTVKSRAQHSTSHQLVKRQYASKKQFVAPARCLPEPNAFLPCQDLFDTWWLRAGIWLVFLLAFTGNILVIVVLSSVRQSSSASALTSIMWLAHSKRHIDVPRFLVINLAIADLLMAFYLGILALVDLTTLGQFKLFAIKWQYSTGCKLAGFLGVLSSELSVFILAIITLERNYAITNAVHLNRRLSLQKAMLIMFIGYAFALGMAIMPLNGISDYRKFSICLPLDMDSSLSSQLYIITLIGINTISFVLLLSCYLRMYCAIRGSQAWNTNDLRIAKRMSILVLTDFLCWMPIIIVGLASLFGHHLVGTNGIKILTIFILPLNSIANPFLYAITTKKFKRDLDTLMRRARSISRSLNCSKSAKDPKVFFGYNQYQHELMMNKARKKKSGKHLDKNQHFTNQRCNVATTGGQASSRTRYNARNQIVCTGNQVTMNRTTCSCGAQREPAAQPSRSMAACNTTEAPSGEIAVRQDQARRGTNAAMRLQLQPKIVLDSADLQFNEIDHDMVQMKMSQSINRALVADVPGCRQTCTGVTDRYSSSAFAQPSRHGNHQVVVAGKHYHCHEQHRVCCCCGGHWQVEMPDGTNLDENRSRRPKSADTGFMLGCPNNRTCMNNHISYQAVCFVAERDSSTASSHLAPANRGEKPEVGQQRHLLNVFNGGQSNQRAGDRSASACGYPTAFSNSARTACTASSSAAAIGTHLRPVASSYDTMNGAKTTRSTEKLSQSINKLLFGPVAKAWSSIQISLNSSLTQVTQAASQNLQVPRQPSPAGTSEREYCDSAVSNCRDELDDLMMRNNNNDNNSTTIDDLLLLGSPSNRLLKLNERRMSRSCDAISSQTGQQQNLSTLSNTSTSGNEPTTSQGDHDDDRRILLATIHRIAGSRRKQGQQASLLLHQQQQQQSSQYLRNRCTRCRSWSPALLSKLEDCIYQLRFKIPGLSSSRNTNHEAMEQVDDDSSGQDVDDNRLDQLLSDDEGERSLSCHEINENSSGDNVSDCDVDDSEDKFNERGLLEWTQRRQNMFKRHHIQRQSIKSNTNSDTLSTRTGGTVLTNMSVSFDSNTGVPVTCHRTPLAGNENRANYVDEKKV